MLSSRLVSRHNTTASFVWQGYRYQRDCFHGVLALCVREWKELSWSLHSSKTGVGSWHSAHLSSRHMSGSRVPCTRACSSTPLSLLVLAARRAYHSFFPLFFPVHCPQLQRNSLGSEHLTSIISSVSIQTDASCRTVSNNAIALGPLLQLRKQGGFRCLQVCLHCRTSAMARLPKPRALLSSTGSRKQCNVTNLPSYYILIFSTHSGIDCAAMPSGRLCILRFRLCGFYLLVLTPRLE